MTKSYPLQGKRIVITREKQQAKEFAEKLKQAKSIPITIPLITIDAVEKTKELREQVRNIASYQWIVFTSKNAVTYFFDLLQAVTKQYALPKHMKVAAIGSKTKKVLETIGVHVHFVPSVFEGDAFATELTEHIQSGERVLFPKGNLARSSITEIMQKHHIDVKDLIVYETKENRRSQEGLQEVIAMKQIDVLTFSSPSTVRAFVSLLEGIEWKQQIEGIHIACIGPVTEQAAIEYGMKPTIVPAVYTFDELVKEMINKIGKKERGNDDVTISTPSSSTSKR
ncbi:uroporphyrinogen-III synthase [Priestia taiwanensis]|uniref:Uroporphyrinogen-III synthase n=1 Tax=Priestia taiwanensis TaxID=1347902 RepID=A0A917AWJ6_9BACI|nr:uroporphyrinogen-III synthase [Priestia taiwanensis]MBM7363577.1 uroporphyrinogen-III synthase [Priestia taiwanensis]GGE75939.1 uroporphyrinogen-III synthase [Priestia taiwanensis]